jgi:hypothetical protein
MRNILLAITSFFATVLILSQVALAESNDGAAKEEDPKHTESAHGDDPMSNKNADPASTEAGVPNAGNKCPDGTCFKRSKSGRLGDKTNPADSTTTPGGTDGKKGTK